MIFSYSAGELVKLGPHSASFCLFFQPALELFLGFSHVCHRYGEHTGLAVNSLNFLSQTRSLKIYSRSWAQQKRLRFTSKLASFNVFRNIVDPYGRFLASYLPKSSARSWFSTADMSICPKDNMCYISETPDFPMFDAFTVDLDPVA